MATTFKTLLNDDVVSTRTLLHEAIPLTGTIVSGTYRDTNVKTFTHGMFESVYDYPFLSSSANHIFDITCGYHSGSSIAATTNVQHTKKTNIYAQMSQVLVGYDQNGKIRRFDRDGDFTGGVKLDECYFLNFSRLLTKDEIKKGSFIMTLHTGGIPSAVTNKQTISDYGGATAYKVNSPAGEYGVLYTSSATPNVNGNVGVGLVYYQAGIVVLTASVFSDPKFGGLPSSFGTPGKPYKFGYPDGTRQTSSPQAALTGATINDNAKAVRNRLVDIDFNNTTELNSTIYFCRVNHNEFNYSSNPTYVTGSKIRVKNVSSDSPVSYFTSIGLYSADNELMAVAKLSEPLKKNPSTEMTLRVRLDY
tara:strand:+ start:779 stop:1864 length:1086 start_codon:yes stop_codon:yes gene_type:complete